MYIFGQMSTSKQLKGFLTDSKKKKKKMAIE